MIFDIFKGNKEEESTATVEKRAPIEPIDAKELDAAKAYAHEQCEMICKLAGFEGTVHSSTNPERNQVLLDIGNVSDPGRLSGRSGQTLDALQIILRAMISRAHSPAVRLTLDIEGYRKNHLEGLQRKAMSVAESLSPSLPRKELDPMNASERRMVHLVFQDSKEYHSYSKGEGRNRRVVIELMQ